MRRPGISASHCRLIPNEGDRLSDIGIKVNRHTIDQVRDSHTCEAIFRPFRMARWKNLLRYFRGREVILWPYSHAL